MDGFKVANLTCTEKDELWSLNLPTVTTLDISPVEVKMLSSSDYVDMFTQDGNNIVLKNGWLTAGCPAILAESITLRFKLTSSVLGSNEQ